MTFGVRTKRDAARRLRREATPAEVRLWGALRGNKMGLKFRRQHPFAGFILDFCCLEASLVVEVDGAVHDGQQDYDEQRSDALRGFGLRVIRLRNEDVLNSLDSVIEQIREASTHPRPLGGRGSGESASPG